MSGDTATGPHSLPERLLLAPLLALAAQLDPRAGTAGELGLALLHQLVVGTLRRSWRWLPRATGTVAAVASVATVAVGGWWRLALIVVVVLPAATVTGLLVAVRRAAVAVVDRSFGSYARPEYRDAIDRAIRDAGLPTSAFGLARMLLRTARHGPASQAERVREAVRLLSDEIGFTLPDEPVTGG